MSSPERGPAESVLERNLRLLFTRSYVPVAPRESFRATLERDFATRAARRYAPSRRRERPFLLRPVPLVGLAAAAGLLLFMLAFVWSLTQETTASDDVVVARGGVAVRQGDGPWEAHTPEAGHAIVELGRMETPLAVATPAAAGARLVVSGASLSLGPWSRLEVTQLGSARLQQGGLEVDLEPGTFLRVTTTEGAAELTGARASLAYAEGPPEHVRIDVASGLAQVDDRPRRRRVEGGGSVRLAAGAVLTEPEPPAVVAAGGARMEVETPPTPEPSDEPPATAPEDRPFLSGTVRRLVRDQAGERLEPVPSFRALLLEEVDLPAARTPTVLDVDDEQGRFAFAGPLQPARYTLFVQAGGYALWRREGLELGGDPVEVEAQLARGTTVRGVAPRHER